MSPEPQQRVDRVSKLSPESEPNSSSRPHLLTASSCMCFPACLFAMAGLMHFRSRPTYVVLDGTQGLPSTLNAKQKCKHKAKRALVQWRVFGE